MDEIVKQHVNVMVSAAKDQNPVEFSQAFEHTMKHKLAARLDAERKLVAASYFSPRQEQSNA